MIKMCGNNLCIKIDFDNILKTGMNGKKANDRPIHKKDSKQLINNSQFWDHYFS